MGLQVPLLVQRQISAQALPYLPLGQTAKHPEQTSLQNNTDLNIFKSTQRAAKSINIVTLYLGRLLEAHLHKLIL